MAANRKYASDGVKESVVALVKKGNSFQKVADMLNMSKTTVHRVYRKFCKRGTVETAPKTGRKKSLSDRDGRKILRQVKANRKTPLADVTDNFNNNENRNVSKKTMWRFLENQKYRLCVCMKKIRISPVNRQRRVAWCRAKSTWTNNDWKRVIFSDESQIVIGSDNKVYNWRKSDEAFRPECISPVKHKKLTVMVWGCITYHGVGTLTRMDGNINSDKYIQIIDNNLWPVIARHFPDNNYIFQDDNAPVHRSRATKTFMEDNHINTMEWPAQSPDINIIENLWLKIKRKIEQSVHGITSVEQLYEKIFSIWTRFDCETIQNLYRSLPSRIAAVRRAKGYITKY